jgi:hypothetical protein
VAIVAAVPPERVKQLQEALATAWRFFSWSSIWGSLAGEDGSSDAFEVLMYTLRSRALLDAKPPRLKPWENVPDGRAAPSPLCVMGFCSHAGVAKAYDGLEGGLS